MRLTMLTKQKRQVLDITDEVESKLEKRSGVVNIHVLHTTAAITTADLDPGTDEDILDGLYGMLPKINWRHPHNPEHAPDHILAAIVGPGITLPAVKGKLVLGSWQRLILLEFDGPKNRDIELSLI